MIRSMYDWRAMFTPGVLAASAPSDLARSGPMREHADDCMGAYASQRDTLLSQSLPGFSLTLLACQ